METNQDVRTGSRANTARPARQQHRVDCTGADLELDGSAAVPCELYIFHHDIILPRGDDVHGLLQVNGNDCASFC